MKIALVAQHATPIPGDGTEHGEDIRLRELSRSLAAKGHRVTVYAQRLSASLPAKAELPPDVRVEYIGPAGPREESELLARVPQFSGPLRQRWSRERPDVVHALRWTSGLAALAAARDLRIPVVQSFDSLGVAERRHRITPGSVG